MGLRCAEREMRDRARCTRAIGGPRAGMTLAICMHARSRLQLDEIERRDARLVRHGNVRFQIELRLGVRVVEAEHVAHLVRDGRGEVVALPARQEDVLWRTGSGVRLYVSDCMKHAWRVRQISWWEIGHRVQRWLRVRKCAFDRLVEDGAEHDDEEGGEEVAHVELVEPHAEGVAPRVPARRRRRRVQIARASTSH